MKKMMIFAAMMVATLCANAQNEVGQVTLKPTVGVNIASMTKVGRSLLRVGVVAGVEAEVGVARNFSISAGALYSQQGVHLRSQESSGFILVSNNFDDYKDWSIRESTIKLDYINIPILAQFYPVKGLAIKAGVQLGVNVLKQVTLKGTIYYQERDSQPINGSYTINDGRDGVNSFYFFYSRRYFLRV